MDLISLAFSSLKMDATSWARMGMRREKMSVPRFLGSVGWNDIGFTRSAPAARDTIIGSYCKCCIRIYTVEPLNYGDNDFVPCREFCPLQGGVLSLEVKNNEKWTSKCVLYCEDFSILPCFGVSKVLLYVQALCLLMD